MDHIAFNKIVRKKKILIKILVRRLSVDPRKLYNTYRLFVIHLIITNLLYIYIYLNSRVIRRNNQCKPPAKRNNSIIRLARDVSVWCRIE